MSYTIRKFDGTELVVLQDGTIDTTTSVALVGRNYVGYGELQNQNFVYLLENFANDAPPPRPIAGQAWFSTLNNNLNVYDGTKWTLVGTAVVSDTAPVEPPVGSFWFDSTAQSLYVWTGQWVFVGPEGVPGFGETRAKSTTLISDTGARYPVIMLYVNGTITGIISSTAFSINPADRPPGFIDLIAGLNFPITPGFANIKGTLDGTAYKATILETTRLINGIGFNGSQDITITAPTPNPLIKGDYILGSNFTGSAAVTWSVDATANNVIGTIVARDSSGDFSAGTITADVVGNLQGNVTASSGTSTFDIVTANQFVGASLSGNANTATRLRTSRKINTVSFDGTQDITIPVSGLDITGTRIANNIVNSNLSTLGTLSELFVSDPGAKIGNVFSLSVDSGLSTIKIDNSQGLNISIQDSGIVGGYSSLEFISAAKNLGQSGEAQSAIIPKNTVNLGETYSRFNKIHADTFVGSLQGNSSTSTLATTSTNLAGGAGGAIPYQTATGSTAFVPSGVAGQVLRSGGSGQPVWGSLSFSELVRGSYLTGSNYDGFINTTWAVDASPSNLANKVVARDSSGNFSAGTVTARLIGDVIGNVSGSASNNISRFGDSMSGFLTLHSNPTSSMHAATKNYVDSAVNSTQAYDEFSTGVSSPGPRAFPERSIRGFAAYSSSDFPGAYYGGITVTGPNGVYSGQIAFNWNSEESSPVGLYFRVNDDTSNINNWSSWAQVNTSSSLRFTYGHSGTGSFSNIVGQFDNNRNFFDVFPPFGFTMSNLVGFIPSIRYIAFAGGVDGNDSLRCFAEYRFDRIRVFVQNTEQRAAPFASYLAIWSR